MKKIPLLVMLLIGGLSSSVFADISNSVLAITPADTGVPGDGGSIAGWGTHQGSLGTDFSVSRVVGVTALANYRCPCDHGSYHSHLVTIVDTASPSVVLASAVVNPAPASPVVNVSVNVDFLYAEITPVLLSPGHTYHLASIQSDSNDITPAYDSYYSAQETPAQALTIIAGDDPHYVPFAGDFFYVPVAGTDFNQDGKSDVLFLNSTTGGVQYWQGAVKAQVVYPGAYDTSYSYAGTGDFDGDGKADILFTRSSNHGTMIWHGAVKTSTTYPGTSASGFDFAAICDVNGDGKADVIWSNPTTGGTQVWSGAVKSAITYPGAQNTAFSVAACADFDGDGKADIFWRNDTTGANEIWLSGNKSTKTYPGANADLTWNVVGGADVNGDNKADLVWFNSSTGATQVWSGGMKSAASYPGTNASMQPKALGDYDGDGKADLLWVNTATNGTQIWSGVVKTASTFPGTFPAGFAVQRSQR